MSIYIRDLEIFEEQVKNKERDTKLSINDCGYIFDKSIINNLYPIIRNYDYYTNLKDWSSNSISNKIKYYKDIDDSVFEEEKTMRNDNKLHFCDKCSKISYYKTINSIKVKNVSGIAQWVLFLPSSINYLCITHYKFYINKLKKIMNNEIYGDVKVNYIELTDKFRSYFRSFDDVIPQNMTMKFFLEYMLFFAEYKNDLIPLKIDTEKFCDIVFEF